MADNTMNTEKLFEEFPPVSTEKWEEVIKEDLKGADYEKKLIWQTPEGFKVKPYYRAEDLEGIDFIKSMPGEFPFVRGNKPLDNTWFIRQDINVKETGIEGANHKALEILQKGVDSVGFFIPDDMPISYEDFAKLMQNIWVKGIEVNFRAGHQSQKIAEYLKMLMDQRNRDYERLQGSLDFDPLGYLTLHGDFCSECGDAEGAFRHAKEIIEKSKSLSNLRVLTVNASAFGNSGASIVQELAFALSMGVEYLTRLTDMGLSVSVIAPKMRFVFSVGSNYFFEIAKLRAARMLWAHIIKSYGAASEDAGRMNIHCVTSLYNKTLYDPYVNMLRTTTEAMAATLGGTDSLEVLPFDITYGHSSEFGERMARNQQLILKEESGFHKIVDPAAGSYYIENLTENIAREAWNLFLKVEEKGGYLEAFRSGMIQDRVNENALKREAAIASRREFVLGTNQYPNLTEEIKEVLDSSLFKKPESSANFKVGRPLVPYRGSMVMEAVRYKTDEYARINRRPVVYLLLIGNVAMRQARAQFSGNFFGCAGFQIITGQPVSSVEEGVNDALKHQPDVVVICSSDEEYAVYAKEIFEALKDKALVVVAGNPPCADELKAAGLTRFIHVRSNLLETLIQYQKDLKIIA
ncbi:MAG: methylmalonyl-CoA mutase small subunit [Bacteroidales bacterium]|jgi:methylmalonyl-CoA mutase|nr:methylmalonyl-CoA mutase small subunit [Bacteroidales bacterium]NPV36965.1 methylmalonyl-CoA mutase small subunit [Bacteroidales bacterium]